MGYYRTRIYLAADWEHDKEVIDKLREWNNSNFWNLKFYDAHDLTQSYDNSLNCTIKSSLSDRMDASKTFVLVVGQKSKNLRSGNCYLCDWYSIHRQTCSKGFSISNKSYIEYECDKAVRDGLKIVVLYNYSSVDRFKCPDVVRYKGKHIAAYHWDNFMKKWNYSEIRDALMY